VECIGHMLAPYFLSIGIIQGSTYRISVCECAALRQKASGTA
jgi:hypothetical protein